MRTVSNPRKFLIPVALVALVLNWLGNPPHKRTLADTRMKIAGFIQKEHLIGLPTERVIERMKQSPVEMDYQGIASEKQLAVASFIKRDVTQSLDFSQGLGNWSIVLEFTVDKKTDRVINYTFSEHPARL